MPSPLRKPVTIGLLLAAVVAGGMLVYVPRAVVYPERYPVTASPADVGLSWEDIELSPAEGGPRLSGWWMPAPAPRATLVFIHGGSSNRHSAFFSALAFYHEMVAHGVSVLAIDLRNHGASGTDRRGIQFGLTEQADALAAIRWAREKAPGMPLFGMGISMGGATLVYAAAAGAPMDGLILLDPLLDSRTAFTGAITAETGLPGVLLLPAAIAAERFFGLPAPGRRPLDVGKTLTLPVLLVQDPLDPVTRAEFASELAATNPNVRLWLAPAVANDHPELAWKKRWGSHVAAFAMFPDEVLAQLLDFIQPAVSEPSS